MTQLELGTENSIHNQFRSRSILGEAKRPKALDMMLKTGIVKTETGAAYMLFAIALVIFIASLVIFKMTFSNSTTSERRSDLNTLIPNPIKR